MLSSLIKKYHCNFEWLVCVSGPAKNIFFAKNIKASAVSVKLGAKGIDSLLCSLQPDFLLTGTGWGSDFEIKFIRVAKRFGIKTASFLDQWGAYRERFGYPRKNWRENLPDFIFVSDRWAYKIALKNGFSRDMLIRVENPYFEEIIKEAESLKCKNVKRGLDSKFKILYLSEPICSHSIKKYNKPSYWGFTEYDVLKDLANIMNLQGRIKLKVRLHPSEKINKYDKLLKNRDYRKIRRDISVSSPLDDSLVKNCIWADVAVGSDTVALGVACLVGKKAVSYVPGKRGLRSLPYNGIKKANSANELKAYFEHVKTARLKYKKKAIIDSVKTNSLFAGRIGKILCRR